MRIKERKKVWRCTPAEDENKGNKAKQMKGGQKSRERMREMEWAEMKEKRGEKKVYDKNTSTEDVGGLTE